MEELDKIYGKCNNPISTIYKVKKEICEAKERAAGPDGVIGDPITLLKL